MGSIQTPASSARRHNWNVRYRLAGRRYRLDGSIGLVLGLVAMVTGAFLAGGILVLAFGALVAVTAQPGGDPAAERAAAEADEARRMLATLDPQLAATVQSRLGVEAAVPPESAPGPAPAARDVPVAPGPVAPAPSHASTAWDTSGSVAPPR